MLTEYTDSKLVRGLSRYPFDTLLDNDQNWQTENGFKNYLSRLHILDSRAKLRFTRMLNKIKDQISKPKNYGITSLFGNNDMDASFATEDDVLKASFCDFKPLFRLILEFKLNAIMDTSVRVKREFFQSLRKRKISISSGNRSRGSSFSKAQKRMSSPVRVIQTFIEKNDDSDSDDDGNDLIQMAKRRLAEMSDRRKELKEKAGNFDRVLTEHKSSNQIDRDTLDNLLPDIKSLFEQSTR